METIDIANSVGLPINFEADFVRSSKQEILETDCVSPLKDPEIGL